MSLRPTLIPTAYTVLRRPRLDRASVARFQDTRLRQILRHAYERVPYYRALFDRHGIDPADIAGREDLARIPLTSREDLRSVPVEELVAEGVDPERLVIRRTSGSTGTPITIRRTWLEDRFLDLFRRRAVRHFGRRAGDLTADVGRVRPQWLPDIDNPPPPRSSVGLLKRTRLVDSHLPPREIVRRLRRIGPDIVTGFVGALSRVAEAVDEGDRAAIRPRFVATGAEVLTPVVRARIGDAFGARVFERYGSHEFKTIAWECRETGQMHVCDDSLILEVLEDGSPAAPGERGEVVATALHSFTMPFIRYRLGDLVTQGEERCPCGRPFPTIREIRGRMADQFPLPGGRLLDPFEIMAVFRQDRARWIRRYRFVQERRDRIKVELAPVTHPPPRQRLAELERDLTGVLGDDIELEITVVAEIPIDDSGKFRLFRSSLRSDYDEPDEDRPGKGPSP